VAFPLWVVALVLGREALMTVFRQFAARRGLIIAAIGPAKWKTGFQSVWAGASFFWFFAAALAAEMHWTASWWRYFAMFNGIVGAVTMVGAVALTLYSLGLYARRYGYILGSSAREAGR
jgi:phosphatidylglycerophosphate synthase